MSQKESKSYAELEADLFLAQRAFKRVPSDENNEALAKVKKAFEALQDVKEAIKSDKPAGKQSANEPALPKKPATPKSVAKEPAVKEQKPDDSKKN